MGGVASRIISGRLDILQPHIQYSPSPHPRGDNAPLQACEGTTPPVAHQHVYCVDIVRDILAAVVVRWYCTTLRPPPSSALCITQLSLLYGILPMWSIAVLALTYHVYAVVSRHRAPERKSLCLS
ncbi:hypothetical protein PM082_017387 [Marasmius tenuissimus]|nr:hypothetical protein PM082_017387 [Marasmius tenuissimus]